MRLGQKGSPEMSREGSLASWYQVFDSAPVCGLVESIRLSIGYCESVNGAYPTI